MNEFQNLMKSIGFEEMTNVQYVEGAIAALLTILAIILGWQMSRLIGPKLKRVWERRAGYESDLAGRRIRDMVRRATEAILIGVFLSVYDWSQIGYVVFVITLGIVVGLFANDLIRGVRMPDWLGTAIGLFLFLSIVTGLVGGVTPITVAMEKVGFDLGNRRISLLWIVSVAVTAVILLAVVRLLNKIVGHIISNSDGLDPSQKVLGQKLSTVVILIVAFVVGLDILGIDLTALAFFSGAFGLAIGFGMQKTIGNLIAGIILLMDRSIKPGDVIVVGDSFGWVNKIGVRAVSVITRDGKEHLIPNENLMTTEVENWSFSDTNVRIKIPIGVAYNSDVKLVQELLLKAAGESPRVLKRPEPKAWMLEFGDNSVNFEIRAWINDPQAGIGNVRADIMTRVWDLFKKHEIEIPFPQRDVHLKELPEEFKALAAK